MSTGLGMGDLGSIPGPATSLLGGWAEASKPLPSDWEMAPLVPAELRAAVRGADGAPA